MTFAADLYSALYPLARRDATLGYPLRTYTEAIADPFEWVEQWGLDRDDYVGWSGLLDPATCPDEGLPWLAQFVGVQLSPNGTPAQWRAEIAAHVGWNRGTPAAIIAAAQATLVPPNGFVWLFERDGDAYHLTVETLTGQTPDPAATEAAIRAALPAGITLTFTLVAGSPYSDVPTGQTYAESTIAWPLYRDRTGRRPGP